MLSARVQRRVAAAPRPFPHAGEELPLNVAMARTTDGETCERDFSGRRQRPPPGGDSREHVQDGLSHLEVGLPAPLLRALIEAG